MGSPSSGSGLETAVAAAAPAPMRVQGHRRGRSGPAATNAAHSTTPTALRGPWRRRPLYRAGPLWACPHLTRDRSPQLPLVRLCERRVRSAWGRRERETGTGEREKPEPGPRQTGNGTRANRERGTEPGMRRRRRGDGAGPAEPCGVWLDTAELKRGPARVRPGRS